jgi:hypothetical protein
MDLNKKIEEIRNKPENIRLRYVWGSVGFCMLFVVIFWAFSIRENLKSINKEVNSPKSCIYEIQEKIGGTSGKSEPSIKEIMNQANQEINEGIISQKNNEN